MMDDMRQGQSQHTDLPQLAIAKPIQVTRLAKVGVRIAAKVVLGVSLTLAGAALAQNVGLVPELRPETRDGTAPTSNDLGQAPPPGTQREAKACSEDIKLLCAPETTTRRDVLQCFEDKAPQVSQSCKSYLLRFADEIGD
jgi:hypothetical protein